jgi:catechol 2,3-dioxygenase-like lactoylglutathione lyase family enzyme
MGLAGATVSGRSGRAGADCAKHREDAMHADFRFDHIALQVRNLAASAAFYGELLGLPEIENKTRQSTIRWFGFDGWRSIHLITGPDKPPPQRPIAAHFCLSTPHFDATLQYLADRGVRYCSASGEPMKFNHRGDGVRQAYFPDPDNYWVEVCEAHADGTVG